MSRLRHGLLPLQAHSSSRAQTRPQNVLSNDPRRGRYDASEHRIKTERRAESESETADYSTGPFHGTFYTRCGDERQRGRGRQSGYQSDVLAGTIVVARLSLVAFGLCRSSCSSRTLRIFVMPTHDTTNRYILFRNCRFFLFAIANVHSKHGAGLISDFLGHSLKTYGLAFSFFGVS